MSKTVKDVLEEACVSVAFFHFAGSGDDGGFESSSYDIEGAYGAVANIVPDNVDALLVEIAEQYVTKQVGAFYDSEGGEVDITFNFDVKDGVTAEMEVSRYVYEGEGRSISDTDSSIQEGFDKFIKALTPITNTFSGEVFMCYAGDNDEGDASQFELRDTDSNSLSIDSFTEEDWELLHDFAQMVSPGFEEGNGGGGHVVMKIENGTLKSFSGERYTNSIDTQRDESQSGEIDQVLIDKIMTTPMDRFESMTSDALATQIYDEYLDRAAPR